MNEQDTGVTRPDNMKARMLALSRSTLLTTLHKQTSLEISALDLALHLWPTCLPIRSLMALRTASTAPTSFAWIAEQSLVRYIRRGQAVS